MGGMGLLPLKSPTVPRRRARAGLWAIVVLSMLGAVLAIRMLNGSNPLPGGSAKVNGKFPTSHDIRTSFGVIAVEHAQAISGLSDADVTGAHGVPGLVHDGSIEVQVSATITNLSKDVLPYHAEQFELLDSAGTVIPLFKAPELPNELQPNAAIDLTLDYVTTAAARPFTVRFVDPGTHKPILIDLGAVGCTVQSGNGLPLPVEGQCSQVPAATDHH